jgi:uncharacterized membrane protein
MTKDSHRSARPSQVNGRTLTTQRLSDYTHVPVEILIAGLSVAPLFVLTYFYSDLPERIPVFLNFHGDVEVWAAKNIVSVFRVPAMAIDLQCLCLLVKYGVVQSLPADSVGDYRAYQTKSGALYASLWDWLRCLIALKMSAESVDILFMSNERRPSFKTLLWAAPRLAAILSVAAALFYGYCLWRVNRETKKAVGRIDAEKQLDTAHLYGGIFYYNRNDPTLFVNKYLLNLANKWLYVLLACVAAYPLLVFSPLF